MFSDIQLQSWHLNPGLHTLKVMFLLYYWAYFNYLLN